MEGREAGRAGPCSCSPGQSESHQIQLGGGERGEVVGDL